MSNQRYPWLKLHRRLLGHPWLNQRAEWFAAWVQILILTDHETGGVELGEVPARNDMTEMAWRHFVKKLEREGMIFNVRTENKGRAGGMRKLAQVTNWQQYQALPEEQSKEQSLEQSLEQSKEQSKEQSLTTTDTVQTSQEEQRYEQSKEQGLTRRLEQSLSILDLEVKSKEGKEDKERTFEAREPLKSSESKKAYGEVAYTVGHHNAEWLRDKRDFNFERVFSVWGEQLEALWRCALDHGSRKAGDRAIFRFQDACEGNLDFEGLSPPGSVTRQMPATEQLPPGTPVTHPVWGDDIVRYYRQDGQIVLNECGALVLPSEVTPCLN